MKAIKAVYNLLMSDANVTVGIYPQRIPEGVQLPAISLSQISRVAFDTKKEYSKSDESRVQINIVAPTATEAYDLSDLVREAMSVDLPNSYNGVLVQNIAFQGEITLTDDDASYQGVFMVAQDYFIMFSNILVASGYLLLEDESFMLLEDGNKIEL
jgi:hypothetical protein